MYYYPVERVNLVVGIISAIFAAALLVSAIIVLYFIKPMGARLGVVGAFTVVFATSILLLTNSRRVEVYGATAAYVSPRLQKTLADDYGVDMQQCLWFS